MLNVEIIKSDKLLNISKLIIIFFFAIVILFNFVPFFENVSNSYVYGLQTIRLLEGSWSVSNEYLDETGSWDFVPGGWKLTIHDTAIPKHSPGLPVIGTIFYLIGGLYGLFYLGPIIAIALLVVSERIATNLFGKYVGFITLLFLATNGYIFSTGKFLLSDNLFALITIIGFFYLIKFVFQKNHKYLLIASFLFVFSTFIRTSGIVYFPIEISIVCLCLILQNKKFEKLILLVNNEKINNQILSIKFSTLKTTLFVIGPWLIYILFFITFNDYYFGDPFTTFYNIPGDPWIREGTGSLFSILEFNQEHVETMKSFSNYVLPYPVYRIELLDYDSIINERDDFFTNTSLNLFQGLVGQNNLGYITFIILIIALIISWYTKSNIIITSIFSMFIFSMIMFWTSNQIAYGLSPNITGRYMMSTFPFMSMILGFIIFQVMKTQRFNQKGRKSKNFMKIFKLIFISMIILFFTIAFYNSPSIQLIKNNEFEFNNPVEHISYYPLDLEGVNQNSIMVGGHATKAVDYGFITFHPYAGQTLGITGYVSENVNQKSIDTLKELSKGQRDLISFKELSGENRKLFHKELVTKYGFIIEDFSPTFCKIKFIENLDLENAIRQSDEVCYT